MGKQAARHRIYRQWKPGALTWAIAVFALAGLAAGLYPMTAAWLSSYNQSRVILQAESALDTVSPAAEEQIAAARAYNSAMSAGIRLDAGGNVPVGTGSLSGTQLRYEDLLNATKDGLMARIKIPKISVDLPIYHGTSDATLLKGAGHLEGSHLPVGGSGTRSVITGHRGLASSMMFTDLDQVERGDTFSVETLGEVLLYKVVDIQVIDPSETSSLRALPDRDLVTLITCTPLGINSQRIVVTGERMTPTPPGEANAARSTPTIPGFPWWAVLGGSGLALVAVYGWYQGFMDGPQRLRARRQESQRKI